MTCVLDASAMIAFLRSEPGGDRVLNALTDAGDTCVAHSVNLCEVYYDFHRILGPDGAAAVIASLAAAGIQEDARMDTDFWRRAGAIKAQFRRVSLADCFCVALAELAGGKLLTADRHELEALATEVACNIEFIR